MSRGQTPRRPEFFPRMKIRGARRRREYAQHGTIAVELVMDATRFSEVLGKFAQAAATAAVALGSMAQAFVEGVARAAAAEVERITTYMMSDRYQLDLIAVRYRHDPIAWSDAVRDFYVARINREFDDLDARAANARLGIPLDPWQTAMAALYHPEQIARIA